MWCTWHVNGSRRRGARRFPLYAAVVVAAAVLAPIGFGVPDAGAVTFSEYTVPTADGQPWGIAAGPDGALWFTELEGNKIGRITTAGVITEFTVPTAGSHPTEIAAGPDGAMWFTENEGNKIGRITTAGVITEFTVPTADSGPRGITAGPDGALWFTEESATKIGRITTSGVITEFPLPSPQGTQPLLMTVGPDGALWFTELGGSAIGRITTGGTITEFPVPGHFAHNGLPFGITAGPDGAIWFTEEDPTADLVARITTDGTVTEFPLPEAGYDEPLGIVMGPDGALWFVEGNHLAPGNQIGKLTTGGTFSEFTIPTPESQSVMIAVGPDGALWFTERVANKIGRITVPLATDLSLAPEQAGNPVGTAHTVTATAEGAAGTEHGVTVGFRVTGANTASGVAATDVNGEASFTYTGTNAGQDTVLAFADNDNDGVHDANEPTDTAAKVWFTPLGVASGSFVIGDQNAAIGTDVTFSGAQWSKRNSLSTGAVPNSFKGFAASSANPPTCSQSWTASPGSSVDPPATVPEFMAAIVSSSITKSGSTISGDTTAVVVIQTTPGSPGTGTVVGIACTI